MDPKLKLNTMERMVICSSLQHDIVSLLDILDAISLITEIAGSPPDDIQKALDAQLNHGLGLIFEHAAQA